MQRTSRRTFLQTGATAALAAVTTSMPSASNATQESTANTSGNAFHYRHVPAPLPFAAASLSGLSEKLILSHWENNYGGSVQALNTVRARLQQALHDADTPPYVYNGLKREQLLRTGSVVLHELYFANLGGDGQAPADLRTRIEAAFGSYDAWESEFRKIALGLGGGSGWVVLGFNTRLQLLENYWLADHGTNPPATTPVLVLDMYEHAYHIDYGAAAAKYIDAFFANIRWDAVAARL